ncbi:MULTISPECIES: SipW-dependent-type signal peptide-containing protein [Halobacterium]|uniref:SipW-dependent-type signal peptide-containing protein n=1 Tax=Halobacterium TaxID=2239 RepID=UPI00073EF90E|nr:MULTISPECIES: SipW-dependent-type signal peptide-containing protein [Halobacterium]MCG1003746.1 SipW-dependent-type signal peptide-containing protein [Halobacterium noricense]
MSDDEQHYRLSRRNVLAGLGSVGLASASAGLGTTALLGDTETFEDNTITAGTMDARLDWQQRYRRGNETEYVNAYPDRYKNDPDDPDQLLTNSSPVEEPDGIQDPIRTRDDVASSTYETSYGDLGETDRTVVEQRYRDQFADSPNFVVEGPVIDLDDVKPGDSGSVAYSVHLFDEPGYVWLGGSLDDNSEGAVTEPELDAAAEDDPGDGSSAGELLDAVEVTLWYDDGDETRESDETPPERPLVFEGTLGGLLATVDDGIPLDGDPGTAGRDCFPQDQPGDEQVRYVGFEWELPASVGNVVQGDSVTFDLTFAAVQCRNNDGTTNPFTEG